MKRYHMIKGILGGSDVYDESGKQVGYSLPSVLGDGEDFYDMDGNAVGMSFDDEFGGDFMGVGNGSYGMLDQEILMGRNAWLHGDPFAKQEEPEMPGFSDFSSGNDLGSDSGWDE